MELEASLIDYAKMTRSLVDGQQVMKEIEQAIKAGTQMVCQLPSRKFVACSLVDHIALWRFKAAPALGFNRNSHIGCVNFNLVFAS
jgi:hypothetical protein